MAEEVKKDEKELEKKTAESNFEEEDSGASQVKKVNLFDQLFANNNKFSSLKFPQFRPLSPGVIIFRMVVNPCQN